MDGTTGEKPAVDDAEIPVNQPTSTKPEAAPAVPAADGSKSTPQKKTKGEKSKQKPSKNSKKSKKAKKAESSSSESSSSSSSSENEDDNSDSSSSSDTNSSEDERAKRRKAHKKRGGKKQTKSHHKRSKRRSDSDSESDSDDASDSYSDSGSSEDDRRRRTHRRSGKISRRARRHHDDDDYLSGDDGEIDDAAARIADLQAEMAALQASAARGRGHGIRPQRMNSYNSALTGRHHSRNPRRKKKKTIKRASTLEYKRVDQLWDSNIHDYKLTESAEQTVDVFQQYIFTVRRKFDWENKYKNTVVDIKSKLLKEALQEVMKDVKGISLVEEEPSIDPNMLFLYLEELRTYYKKTLKAKVKAEKKKKVKKQMKRTLAHCKLLVHYLDEDYEETKKTLYPMLEAGNITFELLWALFKPNTIAFTNTYGSPDDPRCYKVDYATKESSFMRGEWYCIEGRYLEYDGKSFGLGDFEVDVESFKGPRKITSLTSYPLSYHKDPEGVKKKLIERGKHFVSLEGMNYRFHKGLAFMKKKKAIAKVNINGRVMIDPAIFRRINPNYPISPIKVKEPVSWPDNSEDEDDCSDCCGCGSDEDEGAVGGEGPQPLGGDDKKDRTTYRVILDKNNKPQVVEVNLDAEGEIVRPENIDKLADGTDADPNRQRDFTEEELLIASPVVVGFAFSEKLWLEFSLSGIKDIEWNEGAFESLVLPENQKTIVKALVESHKFHAAKTIDDVVQGKGKGLVAVLHGSPGTGKTLTAEGIAELLKCPLYMVSAGELGTDPGRLEQELQKILDIAHSWGAVLLLDEADVFLEKRQIHDIHRNALVSIFLRLLEYFQGILFLTTNRVETFDDAFQSRIHVALRYGDLTAKAKKAVWKMFLEKVREMEGAETETFSDQELDTLARNNLNGRQIKNLVRTAQALAVNEKTKLSMLHIKRVLEVAESFEQDLKGGTGYRDAMRSYT